MKRKKYKTGEYQIPDYELIMKAIAQDVDAINAILRHYDGYISALSTRTLYDEEGVPHRFCDEEMKRRLETKLITKILEFRICPRS